MFEKEGDIMEKILEELKNMQEFSKRVNKNLEREVKIKERQDKIFLIVILLLLVIVLSVLSTLLNLKLLEG